VRLAPQGEPPSLVSQALAHAKASCRTTRRKLQAAASRE